MARTETSLSGVVRPRTVMLSTVVDTDTIVVRLWGEHDSSTVPALAALLASAVDREEANLVVDLSNVQFINAATIRVLAAAGDFWMGQSRTVTLRSPSRCARRVLDLCSMSGLCEPEGT